ncbi:hypothetical protein C8R46DRAFT_1063388 [Mycena filopes]|nr:hypothetical protein C8R46DRAFT_1063388 [Mycena filopes]
MASRLGRQTFSTATRTARSGRTRSNLHAPRRHMSADTHHEFKPKPDLPWIIGASVITLPTLAYLLKDTMAIKQKIAAGHHGHEEHGHEHSAEEGHPAHEEEDADASKDKDKDSDESKDAGATEEKSKSADSTSDAAVSPV